MRTGMTTAEGIERLLRTATSLNRVDGVLEVSVNRVGDEDGPWMRGRSAGVGDYPLPRRLRRPRDLRQPRRRARGDDERRAHRRLPRHRAARHVRRNDRILAAGALPRIEVAQALPRPLPRGRSVLRGARGPDPRRRGGGARAADGEGAGDAETEGARRDLDRRDDLVAPPERPEQHAAFAAAWAHPD